MVWFYSVSSSSNQLLEIKMNTLFLFFAAVSIGLSYFTGNPLWSSVGSIFICIWIVVEGWAAIDRWLCTKTPWYFRLWWCAQWVRKDIRHPSFSYDWEALGGKVNWERKKLVISTNLRLALGCKHSNLTKGNLATRLTNLTRSLHEEYEQNICKRCDIARRRDTPSPSQ